MAGAAVFEQDMTNRSSKGAVDFRQDQSPIDKANLVALITGSADSAQYAVGDVSGNSCFIFRYFHSVGSRKHQGTGVFKVMV